MHAFVLSRLLKWTQHIFTVCMCVLFLFKCTCLLFYIVFCKNKSYLSLCLVCLLTCPWVELCAPPSSGILSLLVLQPSHDLAGHALLRVQCCVQYGSKKWRILSIISMSPTLNHIQVCFSGCETESCQQANVTWS